MDINLNIRTLSELKSDINNYKKREDLKAEILFNDLVSSNFNELKEKIFEEIDLNKDLEVFYIYVEDVLPIYEKYKDEFESNKILCDSFYSKLFDRIGKDFLPNNLKIVSKDYGVFKRIKISNKKNKYRFLEMVDSIDYLLTDLIDSFFSSLYYVSIFLLLFVLIFLFK